MIRSVGNISFLILGWRFIIDEEFLVRWKEDKMDHTLTEGFITSAVVKRRPWMMPSYIISPPPPFCSPVISIPLCWICWTCTRTPTPVLCYGISFVSLRLSASLCHAFTHLSSFHPPPLPPRNGFRWANFISVMPLVCNSQFGFSGKWPPLFTEGLFIWTT